MKENNSKKMAYTAILVAIAVVGSSFTIPIFGAKCAPIQHLINVISAVCLGPGYALAQAFMASVFRNMLGLGSVFAFPGSMFGAFLSGILYKRTKHLWGAYFGEVFGTGILGGIASYPIAYLLMGNKEAALFTFVTPFLISTIGGTIIAIVVLTSMDKSGLLHKIQGKWQKSH